MNTQDLLTSESYPILSLVFSNLNAKQLGIASQVCSVWCKEVQKELKRRRFWDSCIVGGVDSELKDQAGASMKSYFNEIPIVPKSVLILSNRSRFEKPSLPKNCCTMNALVDGIIGQRQCELKSEELEEADHALSFLCFRQSSNVQHKTFDLGPEQIKSIQKHECTFFSSIRFDPVDFQNGVIFLLARRLNDKIIEDLVSSIKKDVNGKKLVIIGGQCRKVQGESENKKQMIGFILYGAKLRPFLQVYKGESKEELSTMLSELKERTKNGKTVLKCKQSLMLMASCVGRGVYFYGSPNVECDVISKVFPALQVFGMFGLGEVAYDSSNDVLSNSKCAMTYTSVFCLLQVL